MEARRKPVGPWLWTLAGVGLLGLLVFVLFIGPWLFTRHPTEGLTADQELNAKNAVRTTLIQAVGGLALAGGLVVTYRTFRHTRIESDRNYVNELYTNAVEQLGHDKAPVRLGALYSLQRLAETNPGQRQVIVDVLCAYLRMPYAPPEPPTEEAGREHDNADRTPESPGVVHDPSQEELQVRRTAQRILATHTRRAITVEEGQRYALPASSDERFWPDLTLDLSHATLVDFDLRFAKVDTAVFTGARFTGDTRFDRATFTGDARFDEATFTGNAWFDDATFTGDAWFLGATFTAPARMVGLLRNQSVGNAEFRRATFTGDAWFLGAKFTGDADFRGATFTGHARFPLATFTGSAGFRGATFTGHAVFRVATFTGNAWFDDATFTLDAVFRKATFTLASFERATFTGKAWFHEAIITGDAWFDEAIITGDALLERGSVWPAGWTVRRDPDNPSRGTLVRDEQVKAPGPAVPPEPTDQ